VIRLKPWVFLSPYRPGEVHDYSEVGGPTFLARPAPKKKMREETFPTMANAGVAALGHCLVVWGFWMVDLGRMKVGKI